MRIRTLQKAIDRRTELQLAKHEAKTFREFKRRIRHVGNEPNGPLGIKLQSIEHQAKWPPESSMS